MGKIWDFLRSGSLHFGPCQNVLKLILKSPRFVQFGANLTQFGANLDITVYAACSLSALRHSTNDVISLFTCRRAKSLSLFYSSNSYYPSVVEIFILFIFYRLLEGVPDMINNQTILTHEEIGKQVTRREASVTRRDQ